MPQDHDWPLLPLPWATPSDEDCNDSPQTSCHPRATLGGSHADSHSRMACSLLGPSSSLQALPSPQVHPNCSRLSKMSIRGRKGPRPLHPKEKLLEKGWLLKAS